LPVVALAVVAALAVVLLLYVGLTYNRLVRRRVAVDNSWAQIDVQLKRRHDLLPNLVAAVEGYAGHERQTLDQVAALRSAAMSADGPAAQAAAESRLTSALGGLYAVAEQYPQLKASGNFLGLQEQLDDTENRVAYARQFYNDAVYAYNRRVSIFPSKVVASAFGFRPREFFEAVAGERSAVPVSFPG
jgi:LemA protein